MSTLDTLIARDAWRIAGGVVATACAIALALLLTILHLRNVAEDERQARQRAEAAAATAAVSCPRPLQPGDRSVITVRLVGGRLETQCQLITDWRSPERIAK